MTDQRISWFHGPGRPVGGNTTWIKPADEPDPEPSAPDVDRPLPKENDQ